MRRFTRQEQKELADWIFLLIVVVVVPLVVIAVIWQNIQFYLTIITLLSLSPKQVTLFKIYPRTEQPVGTSIEFNSPDPIIDDFLHALTDIRPYRTTAYDSLVSDNHLWFLEITTDQGKSIQISCFITFEKAATVIGSLGKFVPGGGGPHYGYFQSKLLFQWYQKHSHRWLKSEEST